MVTIHNFGLNNIDLEGVVEKNETSERIRTVQRRVSGFLGERTAFELPPKLGFRVLYEGKVYYGLLDEMAVGDPPRIFRNPDGGVTILADDKYDLVGKLMETKPEGIENFWQISVTEATGGGGAHNTAFGQQIYLSGIRDSDIGVRLVIPVGHSRISERLPTGLEYYPIHGYADDDVPLNLNFTPVNGKKITLRSKAKPRPYDANTDLVIAEDDVIVLNTVRESAYLSLLENALTSNPRVRLFISATDSMIDALSPVIDSETKKRDTTKVWQLIERSELYVSNREELEKLVGKGINDETTLAAMMARVQSALMVRDGMPGRVYITFGESGSAAYGSDRMIYYQPTASGTRGPFRRLGTVNTNGCGDAYLSVVAVEEVLGHPTIEVLNYANAAGHICATMPTASGSWMATPNAIKDFRERYGRPDFHRYEPRAKEFIRMSM